MNNRISVLALVSLFVLASHAFSQDTAEVTYIANEGFMVEVGEKKILLDALFGGLQGDWADQPDEATAHKLVNGQPPFDDVDLVTVSHKHVDHFDEQMVIQHILSNPRVRILCSEQVEEILKQNPDYMKIKQNVVAVTPNELKDTTLPIAGINVRVIRLEHSHYMETDPDTGERRNRHASIENLGFVLDVDGYKIFHSGDTNPFNETEYTTFALHKEQINLAFLERMFMAGEGQPGIQVIEDLIKPKQIVLMHIGPARRDLFKSLAVAVEDRLPGIHVFDKPMDQMSFRHK